MNEIEIEMSVEALKSGDREAFARLVDETSGHVHRVAFQILGNEQDAEDVLQDTYIKALRALPDFEGRSSLRTWLYRIAVNEALMLVRKRKPQAVSVDETTPFDAEAESEGMEIVDFCCLPEGELLSSESRIFIDRAIQNLPSNLKVVFIMRDLEGLSIQETAEALNLSENNVKTRLLRARLRLRQELSVYFGGKIQEEFRR
ncbi:MAG TPA: sigma-70 family RNA polymerase sigma factor [Anaerolineaceae bacterium]|nr:sigma-70 family RNA polymerase sigma factor [Anaerolineaceae bacterium]